MREWFSDKFRRSNILGSGVVDSPTKRVQHPKQRSEPDHMPESGSEVSEMGENATQSRPSDPLRDESVQADSSGSEPPVSRANQRARDRVAPSPIDVDDIDTFGGGGNAIDWKREAHERDAGPDTAPDGSLIYPEENKAASTDDTEDQSPTPRSTAQRRVVLRWLVVVVGFVLTTIGAEIYLL